MKDENTSVLLEMMVSVIFFCTALVGSYYFLNISNTYNEYLARDMSIRSGVTTQSAYIEDLSLSKNEVLAIVIESELPVTIDGTTISVSKSADGNVTNIRAISNALTFSEYTRIFNYDDDGNIIGLTFKHR